jgi:hypothetical protein
MNPELIEHLCAIRLVVGYLGERDQFGWWQSSFFAQGSDAFLSPLFTKTQLMAQCNGVTRAAALIHDERIGVGNVYHLFRLPEDMEQSIHQRLHQQELMKSYSSHLVNKNTALDFLRKEAQLSKPKNMGPILVGSIKKLRNEPTWQIVIGLYLHGFENGQQIFPYFTDIE